MLIIWNEEQIHAVIRERLPVGAETAIHVSPYLITCHGALSLTASALVRMVQRYFFTTLSPALPNFRQANTAPLGSTTL